jgi:two-component system, cell cycle response regulator
MPETVRKDAQQVAEQIRRLVERHPFEYAGHHYKVTVSLGVAASTGEEWLAASELIRLADENLYQAKRQGRNRVVA